jgi:hypothetical protein
VTGGQAPGADSLRAVLDSVFASPDYRWIERPNPLAFLIRWWDALRAWLDGVRTMHPDLFQLLLWGLIVVLVAILVHGFWVLAQTVRAAGAPRGATAEASPEVRGAAWHRREAAQLAREGRYPEAMQAEFLALVLDLDQRHVVRFHPSKTPNEYTYEARLSAASREVFRGLVRSLYGYAFARERCEERDFLAWRDLAMPERYAAAD